MTTHLFPHIAGIFSYTPIILIGFICPIMNGLNILFPFSTPRIFFVDGEFEAAIRYDDKFRGKYSRHLVKEPYSVNNSGNRKNMVPMETL